MLDILIIILIVVILVLLWLVFDMKRKIVDSGDKEKAAAILERLSILSQQNNELRNAVDSKLSETHKTTQDQLGQTMRTAQNIASQSNKSITEITEKLAKLEETNKQVVNFSAQLQNLQDILKNPKQRGVLGEYFLEETLKNVLPPKNYQMQYSFKNGVIVDAVVFVGEKIIPIDSKFSLENYEKILSTNDKDSRDKHIKQFKNDLKLRIDETSKYVKPEEGTMEFAFMFIPSESIYYDLLVGNVGGSVDVNSRDLIDYAFKERHVIIVSPTNFLAYLQTVLQGLRALQIEESAKDIRKNVEKLNRHMLSYEEFMKKLGASMTTTVNHYNNASKEFKKIDKDIVKITGGDSKIEALVLEKPKEQ